VDRGREGRGGVDFCEVPTFVRFLHVIAGIGLLVLECVRQPFLVFFLVSCSVGIVLSVDSVFVDAV
jgi:hypothetical protein